MFVQCVLHMLLVLHAWFHRISELHNTFAIALRLFSAQPNEIDISFATMVIIATTNTELIQIIPLIQRNSTQYFYTSIVYYTLKNYQCIPFYLIVAYFVGPMLLLYCIVVRFQLFCPNFSNNLLMLTIINFLLHLGSKWLTSIKDLLYKYEARHA